MVAPQFIHVSIAPSSKQPDAKPTPQLINLGSVARIAPSRRVDAATQAPLALFVLLNGERLTATCTFDFVKHELVGDNTPDDPL
jgi:hypothetical protein